MITAVPLPLAMTCPLRFTVATLLLLDFHTTFLERLLEILAFNFTFWPRSTTEPALFNLIEACD